MVRGKQITLQKEGNTILDSVSFETETGEFIAVLGQNGAGKSSLLKILSGEEKEYQGAVWINGKLLNAYKPKELANFRAVLSQSISLGMPFLAKEVVMMGRYPHFNELPSGIDNQAVKDALEEVQMSEFSNRNYLTLSGGEQQRVQLARILAQLDFNANESLPKLLLLDEPISSLDLLHQHRVLQTVRKLLDKGITVLAVLHDLNLASQYADKSLVLKSGKAIDFGYTNDVLTEANIKTAYGIDVSVLYHEKVNYPIIVPKSQDLQGAFNNKIAQRFEKSNL